jgi:hypothetical protein
LAIRSIGIWYRQAHGNGVAKPLGFWRKGQHERAEVTQRRIDLETAFVPHKNAVGVIDHPNRAQPRCAEHSGIIIAAAQHDLQLRGASI